MTDIIKMIHKISVCGKGGSGKSVIVALAANFFVKNNYDVVIVDADESNTALYKMLNFENKIKTLTDALGGRTGILSYRAKGLVKELFGLRGIPSKKVEESVYYKDKISLLSIGKIIDAGGGCACPHNAVTKEFLRTYKATDKEIVLVDTEAGVEHFGRGNEKYVDAVFVIVDPSYESLELATKTKKMAIDVGTMDERVFIITNKVNGEIDKILLEGLKERNLLKNFLGQIRSDEKLYKKMMLGESIIDYDGKAAEDVEKILNLFISRYLFNI